MNNDELDKEYIREIMLQGMNGNQKEDALVSIIYRLLIHRGYEIDEIQELMRERV